MVAAIVTASACWGWTNTLAVVNAAAVVACFYFLSVKKTCVDARPEADSFGQRSSCQSDEEESLFSKYTSVDDSDVRLVGHKPLQNVNDALLGIIGWSEVSGDISSATADRD